MSVAAASSALPPDTPTSVYRYYDSHDVLIYVGVTSRRTARNVEHALDKDWWQYVVRQDVDHYLTRGEALAQERRHIVTWNPPFNTQHNPNFQVLRLAYLSAFATPHDESPNDIRIRIDKKMPLIPMEVGDGDLRTRFSEFPLAKAIKPPGPIPVMGQRRWTYLRSWEVRGPSVILTLDRPLPDDITSTWAPVKYDDIKRVFRVPEIRFTTANGRN